MKTEVEKTKAATSPEKAKQDAQLVVKTAVKAGPEVYPGRP